MNRLLPDRLSHVLCLGAHADDIEIGCGGLLQKLLAEHPGLHVTWVVCSANATRRQEARKSAERFLQGSPEGEIVLGDFQDANFPSQRAEVKKFIHALSQRIEPDLVLTHRREDFHQDHRLLAELTWNAFRNHWICEYEIPKYEGDLGNPNLYVPLTSEQAHNKVAWLMEFFSSQHEKPWFLPETFNALMRLRGLECKSESGFAEALHCRKMCL